MLVASALSLGAEPPGGDVPASAWDDRMIGAAACRTCHEREYQDWLGSPHARAWEMLEPADRADPRCLGCHTTANRDGHRGVQCESCHGGARDWWPDFVMRDPHLARALGMRSGAEAGTCARCHTPETPSIEPFDLKRALPRVDHGKRRSSKS